MTIDELEASLPNGFHDAELFSIAAYFGSREARLELNVWLGDMDVPGRREVYRRAVLVLSDLHYLSIDPPQSDPGRGPYKIDSGPGQPSTAPAAVPQAAQPYLHWFFVSEWNAFVRFSARSARLEWQGEQTVTGE